MYLLEDVTWDGMDGMEVMAGEGGMTEVAVMMEAVMMAAEVLTGVEITTGTRGSTTNS